MQTKLSPTFLATAHGHRADGILRQCVHCGFCNATCPTYRLLGDENDGPRGRIYLMKQAFEGGIVTRTTLTHLDRCLTCRNCETTCPSGVRYGRLIEIGRDEIERRVGRPWRERMVRDILRRALVSRGFIRALVTAGRAFRPFLPESLRRRVPLSEPELPWPTVRHTRRVLLPGDCVQSVLKPRINAATARVLDHLGISCVPESEIGCCGAVEQHTSGAADALTRARRNIAVFERHLDQGCEAIVSTASGCGVHYKDYAGLLADDPLWSPRAERVAAAVRDVSELVSDVLSASSRAVVLPDGRVAAGGATRRVAFQSPCTLQHGQRIQGVVERVLSGFGFELVPVPDAQQCCGSAGTWSLLNPALSEPLRRAKLDRLESACPDVIATANVGCLLHLAAGTTLPVKHWIELVDERLSA